MTQAELSPSRVAIPALHIVSFPSMKRLPVGVRVRFEVQTLDGEPLPEGLRFSWRCVNDPASVLPSKPSRIQGPYAPVWDNASWTIAGRHTVQLTIRNPQTHEIKRIEFRQTVDYAANLVATELTETLDEASITPFQYLLQAQRYRNVLDKIATSQPPSDDHREAHQSRMGEIEDQVSRLSDLIQGLDTFEGYPVSVLHIDEETGTRTPLRVWLCYMGLDDSSSWSRGRRYRWRLVDWTNPAYRYATGTYEGTGSSHEEAISSAFSAWDSGNRYPKGHLQYELAIPHRRISLNDGFETDGRSFWDSISTWLMYSAVGLVAVGLMFIPVVGQGAAVNILFAASMLTGSGSAVINIAARHNDGFADSREDLFDGLTIVGNLFGAGTIASTWRMGATLTSTSRLGTGMTQATLIGQVGTDGLQGILLGVEYLDDYQAIMESPDLSPEQRLQRMLELVRSAAVVGGLTYVSVQGSVSDLRQAGRQPGTQSLMSPELRIDLDEALPPVGTAATSGQNVQATVEYRGLQPANQTPGPALASGALARVSRSYRNPRNFAQARTYLQDARERLQAGGSPLKYTDDELQEMAGMAASLSDNFLVRFMPSRFLHQGGDLSQPHLSGRLGSISNGEVQHWSTTFDQLVDSDTHPDMIRRSVGIERYNPEDNYVLILIDRQRYQALGTETLVPTFENMAGFAVRKSDATPDDGRLIREVMTPEYRATYRTLRGEADSLGVNLRDNQSMERFLKSKFGADMDKHKLFLMRYQLERRYGMNAQFEGNGLTRSLHNSPNQQYGALETFTVEAKPQLLSELRAQGVIDVIEELRAF